MLKVEIQSKNIESPIARHASDFSPATLIQEINTGNKYMVVSFLGQVNRFVSMVTGAGLESFDLVAGHVITAPVLLTPKSE